MSVILNVLRVAGAAGVATEIGEAVAHHLGWLDKDKKLLHEGTSFILEALGRKPNQPTALPPASVIVETEMGHAAAAEAPEMVRICPRCLAATGAPFSLAGAEPKAVIVGLCESHENEAIEALAHVEALYLGYAQAAGFDLGASICGPAPDKNAYKNMWGNVEQEQYMSALETWRGCRDREKADTKADEKALKDADAKAKKAEKATQDAKIAAEKAKGKTAEEKAKLAAQVALERERAKFARQMAASKAQMTAANTAEKQATLQAQVDQYQKAAENAERLLTESQRTAENAEMRAKLDALNREIVDRARQPGTSDQSLQQMLMMAAMQQMMAPAAAAPMMVDPTMAMMDPSMAAMMDPAMAAAVPWDAGLQGTERQEVLEELGLGDLGDDDDLDFFYDLRGAGWGDEELRPLLSGAGGLGGCNTGCGLPRMGA